MIAIGRVFKNKIVLLALVLSALAALSFAVPLLEPFRHSLAEYIQTIWWAILLGLLMGGVIDRFVPDEMISHLLARRKKRTVLHAALLGFLLSACSHGILALGIELHKKGASTSSVIAFLMASPWANLPLTIMMFGFFGTGAIFIILAALGVGITTGYIYQFLEKKEWVECQTKPVNDDSYSIREHFRELRAGYTFSVARLKEDTVGVLKGAGSLGNMVMWWILLGIGIASAVGAYVPQHIFQDYMGASALGLLITLAVATVIEVCSEGSAPMAFELFKQTGALGNSFVFLMAGVATDYTEIGLIWSNIGKRAALFLPLVTVPQVILLGWLANLFL
jgi:uncharacterized membrane protein YraQ (UPF0718 family)